ncbi:hypothetical protein KRR26_03000 [Corallococcus sp. M34]|uniref:hypothetical protein n=1 Tax=Citreicoccus inhibens TaxID=2849499 RepID=UPI001C229763|nr:hypothetical protein [Citreicoccus inhibens]MBU8894552.1 hypothetical protein [Citreicoccus inhibens]
MPRRLLPLLVLLATPALAQPEDAAPKSLDGVGRITVSGGWRLTSNDTLFDSWYRPGKVGSAWLPPPERGEDPRGDGPVLTGTFAYAVTDLVELGIDLFVSGNNSLRLAEPVGDGTFERRKLTTLSYGALVGLRFQGVLDGIGPQGLVPFAGILTGPAVAASKREGSSMVENVTQAWMGSIGATLRLSAHWGLTAEYRLAFLRGPVETPDAEGHPGPFSFNGGGNWFTLGLTYAFSPEPSRSVGSF